MDATVFEYREQFRFTQLLGILNDIANVYKLVSSCGKKVANNENTIRDEFVLYLQDEEYIKYHTSVVQYYHVDTEVKEGANGRTDIRFLKVKPYETRDVYYSVECKRLDGKYHLCKEYVDNGIRRFTSGKYSTHLGCNAMLGFVVCHINLNDTVKMINNQLESDEYLQIKSTIMSQMVKLESRHQQPQAFVLCHLWTDLSSLVDV